jgi:hypothetical protein
LVFLEQEHKAVVAPLVRASNSSKRLLGASDRSEKLFGALSRRKRRF